MARSLPKVGIALGSGGAKGLAHIGILKVLKASGIPIDFIAGSSIGSLIGAYYSAHPQIEKLEQLLLSFNKRKGFMLFDPVLRGGFLKGEKIEKFISDTLEGAGFKDLKIPYAAVATNFNTGEEVVIREGDLIKAIRASISVPAIFQPVAYNDLLLTDGGLCDPVPNEVVRKMGSDIVISVNVESTYFTLKKATPVPLRKVPVHSMNILRHNLTQKSLIGSDIVIAPSVPPTGLIGWNYFFDDKKAQSIIKAGEEAAKDALPGIELAIAKREKEKGPSKIFDFFPFFKTRK